MGDDKDRSKFERAESGRRSEEYPLLPCASTNWVTIMARDRSKPCTSGLFVSFEFLVVIHQTVQ